MSTAPVRRSYRVTRNGGEGTAPIDIPEDSVAGDLLIVVLSGGSTGLSTVTPDSVDWVQILAPTVDGSRRMGVWAKVRGFGEDSYSWTIASDDVVTAYCHAIITGSTPDDLEVGTAWVRPGSQTTTKATSVTVDTPGSLVLSFLGESSSSDETLAQISASGQSRWYFDPSPSGYLETMLVHYTDSAVAGLTDEVNVTYPNANAAGIGVQVIIPPADAAPLPDAVYSHAEITAQTYNSLRIGAKVDGLTFNAIATPVGGGTAIVSSPTTASDGGWLTIRINGLNEGTAYDVELRGMPGDVSLTTLRGKTLGLAGGAFVAITGSCQGNGENPVVFEQMKLDNADFFHHQGDLHYRDATTESVWRDGVDSALGGAHMKNFLKTTPMFYRWDNHDWGGNSSWRDSPVSTFAPTAIRELFGSDFVDSRALYQTWVHRGIRFIDTDPWTLRDEADTTPSTNSAPGKSVWGLAQRQWFFQTLLNATEPLIVWFSSWPLYSNLVGNGRWGNYLEEVGIVNNFLNENPDIRARMVAIGGDSHNICADSGANAMWGIPSLNASPFASGGGLASGTWDIDNIDVPDDRGVYSRLTFGLDEENIQFGWEAVRDDGTVLSDWTNSYPLDWGTVPPTPGIAVWDGTDEVSARLSVWDGSAEVPVARLDIAA